jgi:hypothetical protein
MTDLRVADAVDNGVGVLGGFDDVEQIVLTRVVLAIAEDNERAAPFACRLQLFQNGEIESIIKGGAQIAGLLRADFGKMAAAFLETLQAIHNRLRVGGGLTYQAQVIAEADGKGLIRRAQHCFQKCSDVVIMLFQNLVLASTDIDDHAQAEGQFGLAREEPDGLRDAILHDFEILFIQIAEEGANWGAHHGGGVDQVNFRLEYLGLRVSQAQSCES